MADDARGANGQRRSAHKKLTDEEIAFVKAEISAIGADAGVFRFNAKLVTAYFDDEDAIYIAGNIFPDAASTDNRDTMSVRAVLAHEYYGHRLNKGRLLPPQSWLDEFRASYRAATDTPNLSDEERRSLFADAYNRAKEAGVRVKMNKLARKYIYGILEGDFHDGRL